MFKIRDKIFLTFLSAIIIPLIIISFFSSIYTAKTFKKDKLEGLRQATNRKAERTKSALRNIEKDIKTLGENRILINLVDAIAQRDKRKIDQKKLEVELIFRTYAESKNIYYQICYIDKAGREIVRVETSGNNAYVVSTETIKDNKTKNHFKEAAKLEEGDIYVSQFELKGDHGKMKVPYKTIIVYATHVFDSEKQDRGILMLKVLTDNLLKNILMYEYVMGTKTYLLDKEGYYLLHPEISERWENPNTSNTQRNLKNDFPQEIASLFLSGQPGIKLINKQFFNFTPIFFDPMNSQRYWILMQNLPASIVYSPILTFYSIFGVLAFLLIAGVLITTIVFSRKLTRPVNELVKGITTIVEKDSDNLDYYIPVTSNDEIAFLTFSFNNMIYKLGRARSRLQAYTVNLEKKIENKTKEILGKAHQQEVLAEIGNMLWAELDIQDTMDKVVVSVHKMLKVNICGIFMLDKSQRFLRLVSGIGWNEGIIGSAAVEVEPGSQIGHTFKELQPVTINNIKTEARLSIPRLLKEHDVVSGLSVPMAVGNKAVGVMGVHTTIPREFSKDDVNFLQSVGHFMAAAIERRHIEENILRRKKYTENLIETAQDAIISIDEVGLVNVWNQSAKKIFGYSKEEIFEKPLTTIFPLMVMQELLKVSKTNTIGKTIEVTGKAHDGKEIPIEISLSSQDVGKGMFTYTMIVRDITFQKEIKRQLIERSEQLQTLNRELEDFVYIVSHDLKEPLFTIEGLSSRLSAVYGNLFDEKGNRYITRIKANIELMSQKINEIMDVLKVGRVKYVFKDIDSKIIVKNVVNNLESRILDNRIDVIIQEDLPIVFCDEKRLNDVFSNLIINAIKFIGNDNLKRIRIGYFKNTDYHNFFVEDTGIGIRPEYQETIFKIFRRLNDIEVEGTGVGLAIVKKIIELHKGQVRVESPAVNGTGSRFLFTLPISHE